MSGRRRRQYRRSYGAACDGRCGRGRSSVAHPGRTQAFIGGEFVDARTGAALTATNPATGRAVAEVAECDAADVDRAIAAARTAFEGAAW